MSVRSRLALPLALLFVSLGACVNPHEPIYVQGMVGITDFDEYEFDDVEPPSTSADWDLDTVPTMGFAVMKPLNDPDPIFDLGIEGGAFIGWESERVAFRSGGGGAVVAVRADIVFFELFGGGYVSSLINEKMRVFLGAGPLVYFGWADSDDDENVPEENEFDDSSTKAGGYVRGGIEFDIGPAGTLGFTVQYIDTKVEFDNLGESDVEGLHLMVSLTRQW